MTITEKGCFFSGRLKKQGKVSRLKSPNSSNNNLKNHKRKKEKPTRFGGQGADLPIWLFQERSLLARVPAKAVTEPTKRLDCQQGRTSIPPEVAKGSQKTLCLGPLLPDPLEKGCRAPRWQCPRALALDHPRTAGLRLPSLRS